MDTDTNTSSRGTYDWQVPRQLDHAVDQGLRRHAYSWVQRVGPATHKRAWLLRRLPHLSAAPPAGLTTMPTNALTFPVITASKR